jgi:hypothetical protein
MKARWVQDEAAGTVTIWFDGWRLHFDDAEQAPAIERGEPAENAVPAPSDEVKVGTGAEGTYVRWGEWSTLFASDAPPVPHRVAKHAALGPRVLFRRMFRRQDP